MQCVQYAWKKQSERKKDEHQRIIEFAGAFDATQQQTLKCAKCIAEHEKHKPISHTHEEKAMGRNAEKKAATKNTHKNNSRNM